MSEHGQRVRYKCLDVFSGAGGLTLGLEAAGLESVGAIEIDEVAGRTYTQNFGARCISLFGSEAGDIRKIDPIALRETLAAHGIEELDLLSAGPPCQGFSRVGRGKLDSLASREGAFLRDERNGLFRYAVLMVRELRPRVFVFENVPGMLHLRGRNVVEAVCEAVADLGYSVRAALLNSAWYGVPQTRERVFVLGVRDDIGIEPRFPERRFAVALSRGHLSNAELDPGNWRNQDFFVTRDQIPCARTLSSATTVRMALGDLPRFTEHLRAASNGRRYRARRELFEPMRYRKPPDNWYARLMRHWNGFPSSEEVTDHFCRWTPRDFETFRRMKHGDRYPQAVEKAEARYREAVAHWKETGGRRPRRADFIPPYALTGFPDKWRKLIPDAPAWTITAHLGKDTYSHIHYDSRQARTITIREAARLQSFPDAFAFAGNMGDAFRQIGNAVPPLLARAVGEVVIEILAEAEASRARRSYRPQEPRCLSTVAHP